MLSWLLAAVAAATSDAPRSARALSVDERRSVAVELAQEEEEWRLTAARAFPADHWSRDDAFFGFEQLRIRGMAGERRTSPGDILRGIDELLRENPQNRRTTVAPCKPRPFFD